MALISFVEFCDTVLGLKLTGGQRVLSAVAFDRIPPASLPMDDIPIGIEMFGDLEHVPRSRVLVLRCGRGSGKSTLCAAHGIYRLVTADLSSAGPGDTPSVLVLAADVAEAQDTLEKGRSLVENSVLKAALGRNIQGGFVIDKLAGPQGLRRPVRFISIAKASKGRTGRGKSIIEAIIDESEFVAPSDATKMITDTDIVAAIMPRLMKGGRLILCSTPWPAESETSRLFDENFQHPTTALAARAPTLVMRDNDPYWQDIIEQERARDARNAEREYDCITHGVANSFLEPELVDAAVERSFVSQKNKTTSGIDLAFRSDASAHVVTERLLGLVAVVFLEMDTPKPAEPLKPTEICNKYMDQARDWHCNMSVCDSHYIESAREAAEFYKVAIVRGPSMTDEKEKSWIYLRDLFREGKIAIGGESKYRKMLATQLKSVQSIATSGGNLKIIPPRRVGAGHCDLVAALVNACWQDRRFGPLIIPRDLARPHLIKRQGGRSMEGTGSHGRVGG